MRGLRLSAGVLGCLLGLWSLAPAAEDDAPVDKEAVHKAIDKGVAYLREQQAKNGGWNFHNREGKVQLAPAGLGQQDFMSVGVTALAGLALIESGVKVRDPAVKNAAEFVRQAVPDLTHTHALGAALMFLDRVEEGSDENLLKTMGARLLAGQSADGGWGYQCPKLAVEDVRKLRTDQFLVGLAQLAKKTPAQGFAIINGSSTENSCSEFAVMGLWAARRYKVPVGQALATYEKGCRNWQNPDGSFPYSPTMRGSGGTACMTCAGLMGLAYCHGSANEATLLKYAKSKMPPKLAPGKGLRDPGNDVSLKRGLAALEARMKGGNPLLPKGVKLPDPVAGQGGVWPGETYSYMALWSVERVAVTHSLDKVGKLDWYNWGARRLLKEQRDDGSWTGRTWTSPNLDTAFALLFLRRAQPAPDLNALLKGSLPPPRAPAASAESEENKQ